MSTSLSAAQAAQQSNRGPGGQYSFGTHAEAGAVALSADPQIQHRVLERKILTGREMTTEQLSVPADMNRIFPSLADTSEEERARFTTDHAKAINLWSRDRVGCELLLDEDGKLLLASTWTNQNPGTIDEPEVTRRRQALEKAQASIQDGELGRFLESQIGTQGYGSGEKGAGSIYDPRNFPRSADFWDKALPAETLSGHQREATIGLEAASGHEVRLQSDGYAGEAQAFWTDSDRRSMSASIDVDGLVSRLEREPADSETNPGQPPITLSSSSELGQKLAAQGVRMLR